jgi:hypothetical protein
MPIVRIESPELQNELGLGLDERPVEIDDPLLAFRLHATRLGTWIDPPKWIPLTDDSRDQWPANEIISFRQRIQNVNSQLAPEFDAFLHSLDNWMWECEKRNQVEAFCHALRYFKAPKLNRSTLDDVEKDLECLTNQS